MSVGKTTKTKKIAMRSVRSNKVAAFKGSLKKKDTGVITKRKKLSVGGITQAKYNA